MMEPVPKSAAVPVDTPEGSRHKAPRGDGRPFAGRPDCASASYARLRIASGGVSEWLKETDCKSVGSAYAGSNPAPSTTATRMPSRRGGPMRSELPPSRHFRRGDARTVPNDLHHTHTQSHAASGVVSLCFPECRISRTGLAGPETVRTIVARRLPSDGLEPGSLADR